jgi:hypothetical protein
MITMHPGGFGFFGAFPILFFAVFALVFIIIVGSIVQNFKQKHKDDKSPRITGEATVVTKRTHVWGDHSHTDYYATFQFESGDRLELEVPHTHFGYLVEGDKGKLTFQGTRFLEFQRN